MSTVYERPMCEHSMSEHSMCEHSLSTQRRSSWAEFLDLSLWSKKLKSRKERELPPKMNI